MAERIHRHFKRIGTPRSSGNEVASPVQPLRAFPEELPAIYDGDTCNLFAWFAGPKIGIKDDVYPPTVGDTRTNNDVIIATILVLAFFGSLATYKLIFVPPPKVR